jgi:hypothetical protein
MSKLLMFIWLAVRHLDVTALVAYCVDLRVDVYGAITFVGISVSSVKSGRNKVIPFAWIS